MSQVTAPFTDDQVKSLNEYQVSDVMHPFTCGACRDTIGTQNDQGEQDGRLLVATPNGWTCKTCSMTQRWAWEWMADWTWKQFSLFGPKS